MRRSMESIEERERRALVTRDDETDTEEMPAYQATNENKGVSEEGPSTTGGTSESLMTAGQTKAKADDRGTTREKDATRDENAP